MAIINITPQFENPNNPGVTKTNVTVRQTLDGLDYELTYKTNKADGLWVLDVADAGGDFLVQGIGLATGIDILYPYRYLPVPPGKLFVSPVNKGYTDAGLDAFVEGTHVILYEEANT